MTSGLLIFAKSLSAAQEFQSLFQDHKIEKYYLAISNIKPKKKQGLIEGDMEKSRRGSWRLLRSKHNPAVTQFFSYAIGAGNRLFLLKPHSGKTHQIRVALNSLSSPILGDNRYYSLSNKGEDTKPMADRGYLHAYALKFELNGRVYQYVLPPKQGLLFTNEEVKNTLDKISEPWHLNWPKV